MKKIIGLVGVLILGVVLYLFQPWKLWTSVELNEELPNQIVQQEKVTSVTETTKEPKLLKKGSFISLWHTTTGEAHIYELSNGKRILRLENLVSSDGPDVKVVITPIKNATEGWEKYDYFKLGSSKATHGNVNYDIPDNIKLEEMGTVVLWCERFNESFGAASLN